MRREIDDQVEARLVSVLPSERQIRHQQMEFYAFVHFTVNTFTGREWGGRHRGSGCFQPGRAGCESMV